MCSVTSCAVGLHLPRRRTPSSWRSRCTARAPPCAARRCRRTGKVRVRVALGDLVAQDHRPVDEDGDLRQGAPRVRHREAGPRLPAGCRWPPRSSHPRPPGRRSPATTSGRPGTGGPARSGRLHRERVRGAVVRHVLDHARGAERSVTARSTATPSGQQRVLDRAGTVGVHGGPGHRQVGLPGRRAGAASRSVPRASRGRRRTGSGADVRGGPRPFALRA